MGTTNTADSSASAAVTRLERGGLDVTVTVPTYEGAAKFAVRVERDPDGDWRVVIPWPDELSSDSVLVNGIQCSNGVLHVGAAGAPAAASAAARVSRRPELRRVLARLRRPHVPLTVEVAPDAGLPVDFMRAAAARLNKRGIHAWVDLPGCLVFDAGGRQWATGYTGLHVVDYEGHGDVFPGDELLVALERLDTITLERYVDVLVEVIAGVDQSRRDTTLSADPDPELTARRAIRFENACAVHGDYRCAGRVGPDRTVPGAAQGVARFAVICDTERHFTANFCETRQDVQRLAAHELTEGSRPACYFDLDELAGERPWLDEGDVVKLDGEQLHVIYVDEQLVEGEVARYLCLAKDPDAAWDNYSHRVDEAEFDGEVLERAQPDERLPVRYDLADTVAAVVFNSLPAPE